jgi:drug/metabolite transporter (DMT)-like permease
VTDAAAREVAATNAPSAPSAALTGTLLVLLCLIWGSTWLVIKVGLHDVPPFTGACARFSIASVFMAGLAHVLAKREGGGRPPFGLVLAHGTFQFALNFGIVYVAETVVPSGLVAVLWAVFPIFIALASHFVLRTERIEGMKWVGIAVSFSGVALLFATDIASVNAAAVKMGLLVLLAPLCVTFSTLLIKHRASGCSSLLLNRDGMLVGAAWLGLCAFVFESPLQANWTQSAVLSAVYLGIVGTVFTFGSYMWLLRYVPAYRMSLTSFVIPVVALGFGAAVGGEPVGLRTMLGTGLVLGGVKLSTWKPRA